MKKILFLIPLLIFFTSCRNEKSVRIDGTVFKHSRDFVSLSRIDVNNNKVIDSAKINGNGRFKFRFSASEPDFYQVGFSTDNFVTLLAEPGEKIKLVFENENLFQNYSVEGSGGSQLVRMLDNKLLDTRRKIDSLDAIYSRASAEPGFDTIEPRLNREIIDLAKAQRRYNIEFVINNIKSLATIKALYQKLNDQTYVLYEPRDLQYMKITADTLKKYYPDSRHTKALVKSFEEGLKQMNAARITQMMDTLPEAKLDPVLKDINGRKVALSSLRGKYVLLAFWSSESRECITENLQLKEFYRMYNRKGFEIYQISLDSDESSWKAAVKFDELPWISAREENPAYQKNAILFNVRSVPANYLFDPQGNIIASNLHGKPLQLKLAQLFSN